MSAVLDHNSEITKDSGPLDFGRYKFLAGLIGVILTVIGLAMGWGQTGSGLVGSYLFSWFFFVLLTLGCLGLSILHHTTRGSWGLSGIRLFQAGASLPMLGLMFILFLPVVGDVLFNHHGLYEWTHMDVVNADAILSAKKFWLMPTDFAVRVVIYFVSWAIIAYLLNKSVAAQEATGDKRIGDKRMTTGAISLVVFFMTVTFATIDWGMSINPHWFSTIYGVWLMVGATMTALSLTTLIICLNANREPFKSIVSPNHLKDLGNLLFVHVMLWGYTSVSQIIIIWNGNIPETGQFYAQRSAPIWNGLGLALIIGQFLIPWMWLVSPRTKKRPERLAVVCGWLLVMRVFDFTWIVAPSLQKFEHIWNGTVPFLQLFVLFAGMGGIWFAMFLHQSGKDLLQKYDHRLEEMKHVH